MQEYDVALKRILTRPGSALLAALTGDAELRWLNVETPNVRNLRMDLLGESTDGELVQIELQSRNERLFEFRMGEYLFASGRRDGRLPRQIVLYVGEAPLRMKSAIKGPDLSYRFHMVDIRDLDGEALLASRNLGDNVIAILTAIGSQPGTVRRILERIANGPAAERDEALAEFLILAGLRRLKDEVKKEARRMPIHLDIMDNELIGPLIREKQKEAVEDARTGHHIEFFLGQIEKRFGRVPARVRKRLGNLNPEQLKAAGLRLLDAQRIEDLFGE